MLSLNLDFFCPFFVGVWDGHYGFLIEYLVSLQNASHYESKMIQAVYLWAFCTTVKVSVQRTGRCGKKLNLTRVALPTTPCC